MCAVASARVLYPRARRYLIVSLGTGTAERPIPYEAAKDWGLLGWARPILSVIFDGVSDTVDYQLMQQYPKSYFRFQVDLGAEPHHPEGANDDLDDASPENVARLEATADTLLDAQRKVLGRLIRQLRQPPTPRAGLARP
ncbi:MAG: patatin-like phospholipase domain-containing protein [Gammaproteobacteria bacterium]